MNASKHDEGSSDPRRRAYVSACPADEEAAKAVMAALENADFEIVSPAGHDDSEEVRRQSIGSSALFVAIVSGNALEARDADHFLDWHMARDAAVKRSHRQRFLFAVAIDGTSPENPVLSQTLDIEPRELIRARRGALPQGVIEEMEKEAAHAPAIEDEGPWKGLFAFDEEDADRFYGREEEIDELFRRVQRNTLTILTSQSGYGKTSLLRAGLFPELKGYAYVPIYIRLPFSRSSETESARLQGDDSRKSDHPLAYVWDRIHEEFRLTGVYEPDLDPEWPSLWHWFHDRTEGGLSERFRGLTPVLVFDQFEEVFTLGAQTREERESCEVLIDQLAQIIENRPPAELSGLAGKPSAEQEAHRYELGEARFRVLITLREEYLSKLERFRHRLPSLMANRMLLEPLKGPSALVAAREPAPELLSDDVARHIVRQAAADAVADQDAESDPFEELRVLPWLLSLICMQLNRRRIELDEDRITVENDPESSGSGIAETILKEFYDRAFEGLPDPSAVRAFVEDRLLVPGAAIRNLVTRDEAERAVGVDALAELETRRLVRTWRRGSSEVVELAHDIITRIAAGSRDERVRQEELARLERQRRLKEDERRKEAERRLEEARETEATLRKERARYRRNAVTFLILGLLALGTSLTSLLLGRHAKRLQFEAEQSREDARVARDISRSDLSSSLVMLGEAAITDKELAKSMAYFAKALSEDENSHRAFVEGIGTVTMRNASFLRESAELVTGSPVWAMDINDRAARLAVGCSGSFAAVSSLDLSGAPTRIEFDGDALTAVAWSPDGERLVVGGEEGKISVRHMVRNTELWSNPDAHKRERIWAVDWSADGKYIVTSGKDNMARIWNAGTGVSAGEAIDLEDWILSARFHPENSEFVALGTSSSGKLRVMQWRTGTEVWEADVKVAVPALEWSPDGKWIASALSGESASGLDIGHIRFWAGNSGEESDDFCMVRGGAPRGLAWSPDGRLIASALDSGRIMVHDAITTTEIQSLDTGPEALFAIGWHSETGQIYAAGKDGVVRSYSAGGVSPLADSVLDHGARVIRAAISSKGGQILTGGADASVCFWPELSGEREPTRIRLGGEDDWPWGLSVNGDGKRCAIALTSGAIFVGDPARPDSFEEIRPPLGADDSLIVALALSVDGTVLAAGNRDGEVWYYQRTGEHWKKEMDFKVGEPVHRLAWHPDNSLLGIVAGNPQIAEVRGIRNLRGASLAVHGEFEKAATLDWSGDGSRLAVGTENGLALLDVAQLRDQLATASTRTSTRPKLMLPHPGEVTALTWAPDSLALALGDKSGGVAIFDRADGWTQRPVLVRCPKGVQELLWDDRSETLLASTGGWRLFAFPVGNTTAIACPGWFPSWLEQQGGLRVQREDASKRLRFEPVRGEEGEWRDALKDAPSPVGKLARWYDALRPGAPFRPAGAESAEEYLAKNIVSHRRRAGALEDGAKVLPRHPLLSAVAAANGKYGEIRRQYAAGIAVRGLEKASVVERAAGVALLAEAREIASGELDAFEGTLPPIRDMPVHAGAFVARSYFMRGKAKDAVAAFSNLDREAMTPDALLDRAVAEAAGELPLEAASTLQELRTRDVDSVAREVLAVRLPWIAALVGENVDVGEFPKIPARSAARRDTLLGRAIHANATGSEQEARSYFESFAKGNPAASAKPDASWVSDPLLRPLATHFSGALEELRDSMPPSLFYSASDLVSRVRKLRDAAASLPRRAEDSPSGTQDGTYEAEREKIVGLLSEAHDAGVESADTWDVLGDAMKALDKAEGALKAYQRSFELADSANDGARQGRALASQAWVWLERTDGKRDYGRALKLSEQAVRLAPDFVFALRQKAIAHIRLGHGLEALDELEKLVGTGKAQLSDFSLAANLAAEVKDLKRCGEILDRGAKQFPEEPEMWRTAGTVTLKIGIGSAALQSFERAEELLEEADAEILAGKMVAAKLAGSSTDMTDAYKALVERPDGREYLDPAFIDALGWGEEAIRELRLIREAALNKYPELKQE